MESNFNNRDFEQYVKTNADQYRMIPSEKVWKGISGTLHTRRRWYGLGLAFLLLLTAISVTWVMISYPASRKQPLSSTNNIQSEAQNQPGLKHAFSGTVSGDIRDLLPLNNFSKQEEVYLKDKIINGTLSNVIVDNTETNHDLFRMIEDRRIDPALLLKTHRLQELTPGKTEIISPVKNAVAGISSLADEAVAEKGVNENKPAMLFSETKFSSGNAVVYPLTIESVVNSYHVKKLSRRISWQLYLAPTVSYRKWDVNRSYHGPASPFSTASYPFASPRDVNSEVVHKPDMGLEVGLSTKYPITRNLKLSAGFQFNINRYDIKAFAYSGEQATINLTGGNGNNSVTAWTYYRNYNGYKSDWLKNFYFSVSAPVGAELRLFGNDKTNFGIASTVQPTYILKDRAFLISSDYKNYVEMPRLIRHLNVNTSFETFISYLSRNGKSTWQIGPQVRYQVLSSFQNQYPVKENLFDFGLKIGLTFNH